MNNYLIGIKIWKTLPQQIKIFFYKNLLMAVIGAFSEILAVAAMGPFLQIVVNAKSIQFNMLWFEQISQYFEIEIRFFIIWTFIFTILSASFVRLKIIKNQIVISNEIGKFIAGKMYKNILNQPASFAKKNSINNLISIINNQTGQIINDVFIPFFALINASIIVTAIFLCLLFLKPIASLASFLSFGLIYFVVVFFVKKILKDSSLNIQINTQKAFNEISNGLNLIRDIHLRNSQEYFLKNYLACQNNLRNIQSKVAYVTSAPRYILEALILTIIAALAYFTILYGRDLPGSVTILGLMIFVIQRILPLIQNIFAGWSMCFSNNKALNEIVNLLNLPIFHYGKTSKIKFSNEIIFKNVCFEYSPSSKILKDINIKIKKGERIGICGKSGSGKSTFLDIFIGFLFPTSGNIYIDGSIFNKSNVQSWFNRIGYVPQDIYLLNASIAENIALGENKKDINLSLLSRAIKASQLDKFVYSLPMKIDTVIGDGGIQISGGQKQRIAIARALYKKADIIILDEATSSLDSQTEDDFLEFINKLSDKLTLIFVSHRMKSLANLDYIYEIKNSKLKRIF